VFVFSNTKKNIKKMNNQTQSENPNPLAASDSLYDQDNYPEYESEEEKMVPLSNVFQNDRQSVGQSPGGSVESSVLGQSSSGTIVVPSSIKTDPVSGLKYVDNYSGLYSKEEVLALHRLDYPVPDDFVFEEDLTSKTGLMPVASFKFGRRDLEGSSSNAPHDSHEQQWEGNFFSRSVGRGKGRGRGRRGDDQYGDESLRGSRGGMPFDPAWRTTSEPYPQDYSTPLWQSTNPNATSFQSSYRPTKRQLAASSVYPSHHSDLYQLQEDLSYANERWYYKDPKGHERGPFSSIQMDKWVKHDFFQIELLVRRENESGFVLLGNLFIAEQRNPFTLVPLPQWLQGPSSGFKNRLIVLIHSYQIEKMQREQAVREQQSGGVVPGADSKGQGDSLPSSITTSVASLSVGSSGSTAHSGLAPPSSELEFPISSQSNPLSESGTFAKGGIHEQVAAPWTIPDTQDPTNKSSIDSVHSPVPIPGRNWYDADDVTPWGQNLEQPSYPWSGLPIGGQSTAWNLSADKTPNVILQEQTKVLTEIVEKMKDKPASKNTRKKKKTKRAKAKEPIADPQNQKKPSPPQSQSQKSNTTAPSTNANTAVTNTNAPKSNPKPPATSQQQPQQHQKSPPQVKKTKPQYKLKQTPEPPEEQPKPVEQPAIKKSIKYGKKPQVWKVVERKEEENVEITGQDSSLHNTEEKI
jgi:hypothetical protein